MFPQALFHQLVSFGPCTLPSEHVYCVVPQEVDLWPKGPVPRVATALLVPTHHLPCHSFLAPLPTFFCSDIPLGFVGHQCMGAEVLQFTVVVVDKSNVGRLEVSATKNRDLWCHAAAWGRANTCLRLKPAFPTQFQPSSLLKKMLCSAHLLNAF